MARGHPRPATLVQWFGLALMGVVAIWLLVAKRFDGAVVIAGLIANQIGLGSEVKGTRKDAHDAAASARAAERSGEYAAVRLDQLTQRKETRDG